MKKALCVAAALLMAVNFAYSQDEVNDFGWYGLTNNLGMDAYYNFNNTGLSARSIGMGGVYYTQDNEGYSSYLNPAGMVYTQKALMSVNFLSDLGAHEGAPFYVTAPYFTDPETGAYFLMSNNDVEQERQQIDNAGAVAPFYYFDREWWVGAGYRKAFDLFAEYSIPKFVEGEKAVWTQHGSVDAVNAGLATLLIPQVSVGMNMNIYVRGYTQEFFNYIGYLNEYSDTLIYKYHQKDKSTFSGTNFDFGLNLDLDIFRAAVTISTPLTLTQNTTYTSELIDDDGTTDGYIDRLTAKNKFPMTYGGGIAFTPNEQLTIGFDITHKPYSKVEIDIDPEQTAYSDISGLDPGWEDLTQFRFGAEYVFDFESFDIPLRAGVQNIPGLYKALDYSIVVDTISIEDELYAYAYDSTSIGDQFNTYVFSFGTGLKFEKIWFDIAYQFGSSEFDQTFDIVYNYLDETYSWDTSNKYAYSRLYISASMLF